MWLLMWGVMSRNCPEKSRADGSQDDDTDRRGTRPATPSVDRPEARSPSPCPATIPADPTAAEG